MEVLKILRLHLFHGFSEEKEKNTTIKPLFFFAIKTKKVSRIGKKRK